MRPKYYDNVPTRNKGKNNCGKSFKWSKRGAPLKSKRNLKN